MNVVTTCLQDLEDIQMHSLKECLTDNKIFRLGKKIYALKQTSGLDYKS